MNYLSNDCMRLHKALSLAGREAIDEYWDIFDSVDKLDEQIWVRKVNDGVYDILETGAQKPFITLEISDNKLQQFLDARKLYSYNKLGDITTQECI